MRDENKVNRKKITIKMSYSHPKPNSRINVSVDILLLPFFSSFSLPLLVTSKCKASNITPVYFGSCSYSSYATLNISVENFMGSFQLSSQEIPLRSSKPVVRAFCSKAVGSDPTISAQLHLETALRLKKSYVGLLPTLKLCIQE